MPHLVSYSSSIPRQDGSPDVNQSGLTVLPPLHLPFEISHPPGLYYPGIMLH